MSRSSISSSITSGYTMSSSRNGKLAKVWDWTLQLAIPAAIIIGGYGIWDANTTSHATYNLSGVVLNAQAHNHSSTIRLDERIKALEGTIIGLQMQNHKLGESNNALAQEIAKDSATVSADAGLVYQQNAAICSALNIPASACPGAP